MSDKKEKKPEKKAEKAADKEEKQAEEPQVEKKKAPLLKSVEDVQRVFADFITKDDDVALLLDFDGTLVPLSEELVIMPKDTEINIKKLAVNPKIFLCVFSGRELTDIKNHLKLENVTYAGNHGLEVEYPDKKKFMVEMPQELLDKHKKLVEELKEKVVCQGTWVDDKKIAVTFHYKGVNEKLKNKLVEDARALIKKYGFIDIDTPYALEGKPRVNWDKGEGAKLILKKKFGDDWSKKLKIIYVGDDTTDEDAIKMFRINAPENSKTIRVCELTTLKTYADYHVKTPNEVAHIFTWLQQIYTPKKKGQ